MRASDLDDHLEEWLNIIDELSRLEYDSSWEWRGETDGGGVSYLEDKREMEDQAASALARALQVEGVDHRDLLERAREICRDKNAKGYPGMDRCMRSIRTAEELPTRHPPEQDGT